jgi:hypothetical protein
VIGLDPVREQLADVSRRAGRRVERGGVPNLVFALATAQRPPEELDGRAGEVLVTLPWGDLLEGLALAHADVLDGLATRMRRLPRLTPEYVRSVLAERYAAHGILVDDARRLRDDEIDALHSTWAKRLRHGNGRPELTLIEAYV